MNEQIKKMKEQLQAQLLRKQAAALKKVCALNEITIAEKEMVEADGICTGLQFAISKLENSNLPDDC